MQKLGTLVTQARKGGVEAYTEIVRRLQDLVVGYAYSILGDFHLAEDAAQETFVAAYLDLPSLSRVEAFTGWLRRIASRRCTRLTRGKHLSTVPVEQEADLVATNPGPEEVAERQEVRHFVQAAIQGLPQREREVTTLLYINGYSQKEVGDFLEITANAVRNRLHAARKKLRERMMGKVKQTLHEQRPSRDESFVQEVTEMIREEGFVGFGTQVVWRIEVSPDEYYDSAARLKRFVQLLSDKYPDLDFHVMGNATSCPIGGTEILVMMGVFLSMGAWEKWVRGCLEEDPDIDAFWKNEYKTQKESGQPHRPWPFPAQTLYTTYFCPGSQEIEKELTPQHWEKRYKVVDGVLTEE